MKSYFAKLAARATLANTPAFPAANKIKVADPFADSPPPGTPFAVFEVGKSSRSTKETSDFPLSRPSQAVLRPENVHPISDTSASPSPESLDHSTTLQPKPLTTISPVERAGDTQWEPPGSAITGRGHQTAELERPTGEPGPPTETLPPLIPVALSLTRSTRSSSDEAGDSPSTETERTEHLAEMQRDQVMLLRKADAFMKQLLDRRGHSTTNPEGDSDGESRSILKPNVQLDQAPRLQPIQAPARMLDEESDQPSLVIGKLTVEVVPPAPAPVVPRQQVVVVRGTSGGRNGIPSSRRFGLGQF